MTRTDVLAAGPLFEGLEPHIDGNVEIVFHRWTRMSELQVSDGSLTAYLAWTLPGMSGLELCRQLRCDPLTARSHITLVLEKDDPEDRRQAIRAGANDHMVAPISRHEVIEKVLWAKKHQEDNGAQRKIALGELSMDLSAFRVRWQKIPVQLMPNEFRLLRYMMENPSRVMTRAQLLEALGKQATPSNERLVDVLVARVRQALRQAGAGELIRTVRSLGYVLDT